MSKRIFLSVSQVRRYATLDRVDIAKAVGCSPAWVRQVLGGKELITGDKAKAVLECAEKMITAKTSIR